MQVINCARRQRPEVFDSLGCTDAAKVPDGNAQGLSHTMYAMAALGRVLPEVFRLAELH